MKKLIILCACLFILKVSVKAQEEAVFGHYIFNPVLLNPAASGFDEKHHNVFMNIRSAWTDFPGTPKTYALSYNGPVGNRFGLGAMLYTENIASITFYRAQLSYAFRYNMEDMKISAGFSTQLNRTRVENPDATSSIFDQNDEALANAMDGESVFDATIGIYGSYKERFNFGLSLPSLIRTRLDDIEGGNDDGGGLSNFIINLGGNFDLPENKVKLMPSIVVKKVRSAPTIIDFNMVSSFLADRLIAGLSYKAVNDADGNFGVILGTKYNALRFVYSYDVNLGDFQKYNGGSHEITINIEFDRGEGKFDRSRKYRKNNN